MYVGDCRAPCEERKNCTSFPAMPGWLDDSSRYKQIHGHTRPIPSLKHWPRQNGKPSSSDLQNGNPIAAITCSSTTAGMNASSLIWRMVTEWSFDKEMCVANYITLGLKYTGAVPSEGLACFDPRTSCWSRSLCDWDLPESKYFASPGSRPGDYIG